MNFIPVSVSWIPLLIGAIQSCLGSCGVHSGSAPQVRKLKAREHESFIMGFKKINFYVPLEVDIISCYLTIKQADFHSSGWYHLYMPREPSCQPQQRYSVQWYALQSSVFKLIKNLTPLS